MSFSVTPESEFNLDNPHSFRKKKKKAVDRGACETF